jgi:hypothetical protein
MVSESDGTTASVPVSKPPVSAPAKGLPLFLASNPRITVNQDTEQPLVAELLSEVRRDLMRAGFRLVDTSEAAFGVTATVAIDKANRYILRPANLEVVRRGTLIGEAEVVSTALSPRDGISVQEAALALVNGITTGEVLKTIAAANSESGNPERGKETSIAAAGTAGQTDSRATFAGAPPAAPRVAAAPQRTSFALVVGIEKYRDLPGAPGARADAEAFADMLKTTFGLPADHVHLAVDDRATGRDLERQLAWIKATVPAGGRVYFYYSGHGSPDTAAGTPYLVPYDASPTQVAESSMPMSNALAALSESKAKDAVAFVDACFSGSGGRSVLPEGARPLVTVKEAAPSRDIALFSAASGAEISGPSGDGKHGAFTAVVLQALGGAQADFDGDGQITLDELSAWVTPRVRQEARALGREQTPKLTLGSGVASAKDFAVVWGVQR